VRPDRKFEVPDGLSRASGLFKPLRHLAVAAPGITARATVATHIGSGRLGPQEGSEVIRANTEVIHAVAEIHNHAVTLSFVHKKFL
jgi:hypothetical protein